MSVDATDLLKNRSVLLGGPSARSLLKLPPLANQSPGVRGRAPTLGEDSAHNFLSPDAMWVQDTGARGSAIVYQQMQNNAGFPSWKNCTLNGVLLPGDAASVAPAAVYAYRRVVSAYTGPIFSAQFADAVAVDIPQDASGFPDRVAFLTAAKAHGLPARVATWYDQSGNARHATQGTAANQSLLAFDRDGDLCVIHDQYSDSTSVATRSLSLPAGLSLTQDALTAFSVSSVSSCSRNGGPINNILQLGTPGNAHGLQLGQYYDVGLVLYNDGLNGSGYVGLTPTLTFLTTSPSSRTVGVDGFPSFTKSGDVGSFTITGGQLGMTPASNITGGANQGGAVQSNQPSTDWLKIVYASTLSAADLLAVKIAIHALGKTTPQVRSNVTLLGESITQGLVAASGKTYAQTLQDRLPKGVRVVNFGWSGLTIGTGGNNLIGFYPTTGARVPQSGDASNICIIYGGDTNDWWNGAGTPTVTASTMLGYVNSLVALARANYQYVFVLTPLDRGGGGAAAYTQLAAIRDGILANASSNNYIPIRVDLDPLLGNYGVSASNTTYFPDSIHPNSLATANIAEVIRAAILPYLYA